jgi:hypothetical protein
MDRKNRFAMTMPIWRVLVEASIGGVDRQTPDPRIFVV